MIRRGPKNVSPANVVSKEEELEQKEKQIKINYEAIDRLRKEIEDIKKYEILGKTVEQWQDLDMSINC